MKMKLVFLKYFILLVILMLGMMILQSCPTPGGGTKRPPFTGSTLAEYIEYLFDTSSTGFAPATTTGNDGDPVFVDVDDDIVITSVNNLWFEIIYSADGTAGGAADYIDLSGYTTLTLTYTTTAQASLYIQDTSTEIFSNLGIFGELTVSVDPQVFTANLSDFIDLNWILGGTTETFNKMVYKIMIGAGAPATFTIHDFVLQ